MTERLSLLILIALVAGRIDDAAGFAPTFRPHSGWHPALRTMPANKGILYQSVSMDPEDDRERIRIPRRRRRSRIDYEEEAEEDYEDAYYDGESLFDDDDDEEDWDEYDDAEEENDLFENTVIPNPLLDSIDPDGAADRFPELARDPRFWFDMVLFIAFLNFLSSVGPRDPFPDIPWY